MTATVAVPPCCALPPPPDGGEVLELHPAATIPAAATSATPAKRRRVRVPWYICAPLIRRLIVAYLPSALMRSMRSADFVRYAVWAYLGTGTVHRAQECLSPVITAGTQRSSRSATCQR